MDFVGVNTVINYDFPHSTADYVHRIGRTGRAGRSGESCCAAGTLATYNNEELCTCAYQLLCLLDADV